MFISYRISIDYCSDEQRNIVPQDGHFNVMCKGSMH